MTRRKSLASREPSGKVRRPPRADPTLPSPTEVRRMIDAARQGFRDPVWGSMLGVLHARGKITDAQFAAGWRWTVLASDYSLACLAPRQPRSANLNPAGGQPPDPDSAQGLKEAQRHTHTKHQYLAARAALNASGAPARLAVAEVCENNLMVDGVQQLADLNRGLSALSAFWNRRTK